MDRLSAMRGFVHVVQSGSFSAAAKQEGVTQGTVSKQVSALEKRLGAQLLLRNQRNLSLTSAGQVFYERCLVILQEIEEAEALVTTSVASPTGELRVTLSPVLSRLVIAPILGDFLKTYPGLRMNFELTEHHCDIIAEGVDVAIRARHLEDSSLIARPLSSNPLSLVAAPAYLEERGKPTHPSELRHHNCLVFSRYRRPQKWTFTRGKEQVASRVRGNFRCDQGDTLVELAVSGVGIALMPSWLMRDDLKAGHLKKLLPGWQPPSLPLQIVYAKDPRLPAKIRCFTDFLRREVRRRNLLPA